MNEWIVLTEHNWAFWVAGLFALAEFVKWVFTLKEWFFNKFGIKTKAMLEKQEWNERLKNAEKSINDIKETANKNVEMFLNHEKVVVAQFMCIRDEIVVELNRLHDKIDEQKEEMDKTKEANEKTDCAILRDRIGSGMRYFSRNVGADGKVHISLSDYENMNGLFQEYFTKHGNGAFKKMYDDEFTKFIIDR